MVSQEEARRIDEEIAAREKLLAEMPTAVRTRIIELHAYPNEVVSRIQQIDGVIVEFQEKY